jgi:hypothetical protein
LSRVVAIVIAAWAIGVSRAKAGLAGAFAGLARVEERGDGAFGRLSGFCGET